MSAIVVGEPQLLDGQCAVDADAAGQVVDERESTAPVRRSRAASATRALFDLGEPPTDIHGAIRHGEGVRVVGVGDEAGDQRARGEVERAMFLRGTPLTAERRRR